MIINKQKPNNFMEKQKQQLVTLDEYREGEEQSFSVIEIFPYLHYENDEVTNELDMYNIFQFSLDPNTVCLNIHVRSEEAQEEVCSYLSGHGFENVKCLKGNVIGMTECRPKEVGDDDEIIGEPKSRNYYTIYEENIANWLLSKSSLSIRVAFEAELLGEFKNVIRKLRDKRSYRNKWVDENHYVIK